MCVPTRSVVSGESLFHQPRLTMVLLDSQRLPAYRGLGTQDSSVFGEGRALNTELRLCITHAPDDRHPHQLQFRSKNCLSSP